MCEFSSWGEHGGDDEADAVRVLRPVMRDCMTTASLEKTLSRLECAAKMLGGIARHIETRRDDPDGRAD